MISQQFAYDSDNDIIYYITHQAKSYVAIDRSQKEVFDFLYHVYVIQWQIIKDKIESNYTKFDRIQDIYDE